MPAFPELSAADRELALLDALLAHPGVGVMFCDPELRYVRVSDSYVEIGHVPTSELLGRRPGELFGELGSCRRRPCAPCSRRASRS